MKYLFLIFIVGGICGLLGIPVFISLIISLLISLRWIGATSHYSRPADQPNSTL